MLETYKVKYFISDVRESSRTYDGRPLTWLQERLSLKAHSSQQLETSC